MTKIVSYKDLIVWQKAIALVKEIYLICKQLPSSEQYILVSQILRAAISIPANIAEGWARNHKIEYVRFLSIAYASSTELETHLIISEGQYKNINYEKAKSLLNEIQKMLLVLMRNIKNNKNTW